MCEFVYYSQLTNAAADDDDDDDDDNDGNDACFSHQCEECVISDWRRKIAFSL